jgi:hypothetical protein
MRGYELEPVEIPEPRHTRRSPAYRHLVESLRTSSTAADYERVTAGKLANHLRRVDEVGAAFDAADLDDLARVLGYRPDPAEADAELVELVRTAGPEREEELVRLLDARAQRIHYTLASPTSLLVRHPRLRSLRPGHSTARGADESWPAGAIPGTA